MLPVLGQPGQAVGQISEEQAWSTFKEWYTKNSSASTPNDVLREFMGYLKTTGKSPEEMQATVQALGRAAETRRKEVAQLIYDKAYTGPVAPFELAPNPYLVKMASGRKPGKALDVAMGQGRNAVWLAQQGWEVTGYDPSTAGLKKAQENAAAAGVKVSTVEAMHDDFDYGKEQWDLIVLCYALTSMDDKAYLERLKGSLKKGGVIIVEQFNSPSSSGAKGPANALFRSFEDMRVVDYQDVLARSDWGKVEKARIGRVVAEKD
jgi:2-polyprenyl-3-methyl-5-hydroxy-6-metoxy-1,4-benzoquinol methylase